jgi:excisionase family DNA binding protein
VDPLLNTINEVCERLSLGRTTVYDLIGSGQLVSVRVGNRRLVPETALQQYVADLVSEEL